MELRLDRETFTVDSAIGKLYLNSIFLCYTLEDKVRPVKIAGATAIPAGRYEVILSFSNRFQQQMPLLLNVPNYDGVRMHWGNYASDTDGCVLVGTARGVNSIGNSRVAYSKLMAALKKATKNEKIFITIRNSSYQA